MSNKQARLVSAIEDAMQAQGFTQKRIATICGMTQSMISDALNGKCDLKEERWRMMCEALALDYDDIIADPVEETAAQATQASKDACDEAEQKQEAAAPAADETVELSDEEAAVIGVVTRYIAKHLRQEISQGTDMSLDDIYKLMVFCKSGKDMVG